MTKFTKMQGLGNDYIYINGFEEKVENPSEWARKWSDRHFGIGSDGLILICPSDKADCRMEMYNADGSRGEMCGNGIRCVAKYAYDHGLVSKEIITVETDGGIKTLWLYVEKGKVKQVKVNMGPPKLSPNEIPIKAEGHPPFTLEVQGRKVDIFPVNMGNPHGIIFWEDLETLEIEKWGPLLEKHEVFPQRANIEFVKVLSPREIQFRVWERGSGETLACGTGACAVAVACHLQGKTEKKVLVHLLGGELEIEWAEDGNVYMTGPCEEVFQGEIEEN